jgi:hypothetical protein
MEIWTYLLAMVCFMIVFALMLAVQCYRVSKLEEEVHKLHLYNIETFQDSRMASYSGPYPTDKYPAFVPRSGS